MQLLRYIIIVFGVSVLLSATGTWVINKGLERSGVDFYGKINAAVDSSKQTSVLLIGSSRVLVHLNPAILDSVTGLSSFNYGLNSGSIKTWYNIAKCALHFQKNAKVVVLNVDYGMFRFDEDPYKDPYYYPFEKATPGLALSDSGNASLLHSLKWFDIALYDDYAKYAAIDGWLRPGKVLQGMYKGYFPNHQKNLFEMVPDSFTLKQKTIVPPEGMNLLHNFILLCKAHHTKLILVVAPYFRKFSPEKFSPDFNAILNTVQRVALENDIPFFDYTNMDICKGQQYFYNVFHLNSTGANLYTQAVADSLKSYLNVK